MRVRVVTEFELPDDADESVIESQRNAALGLANTNVQLANFLKQQWGRVYVEELSSDGTSSPIVDMPLS